MKRVGYAAAAIVLVLAAGECGIRLFAPGMAGETLFMRFSNPHRTQSGFVPDDRLFWRLAPNNATWEVNEAGFRGPSAPTRKPAGELRVACLGDSCTFGLGEGGIPYAQTYPAVLQGLLHERSGTAVRVLNFGCPGYTSFQGARLLESVVLAYRPDVVIAYFGINDGFDAVGFADKDQRPVDAARGLNRLLGHSAIYRSFTHVIVGARRTAGEPPLERVGIEDYHRNLDTIAALARDAGARVYFIAPPYLEENGDLMREDHRLHEPALDIMPGLRAVVNAGGRAIFPAPDNVHPTPAGHAAIARAAADRLTADLPRGAP